MATIEREQVVWLYQVQKSQGGLLDPPYKRKTDNSNARCEIKLKIDYNTNSNNTSSTFTIRGYLRSLDSSSTWSPYNLINGMRNTIKINDHTTAIVYEDTSVDKYDTRKTTSYQLMFTKTAQLSHREDGGLYSNVIWSLVDKGINWTPMVGLPESDYLGGYDSNDNFSIGIAITPASYTVSFNANGGSGAPGELVVTKGEFFTVPSKEPVRQPEINEETNEEITYTFEGWAKKENATSPTYFPGTKYKFEDSTTLYAVWSSGVTRLEYKVLFDSNIASAYFPYSLPKDRIISNNFDFTIPKKEPFADYHNFKGWMTSESGQSVEYSPGSVYRGRQDITLFALWEPHTHHVNFDINFPPSPDGSAPDNYEISGFYTTAGMPYQIIPSLDLSEYEKKYNCVFAGWNTKQDGTGYHFMPNNPYTLKGEEDITLYGQWKLKTAYFAFYKDGICKAMQFSETDLGKPSFSEAGDLNYFRIVEESEDSASWYYYRKFLRKGTLYADILPALPIEATVQKVIFPYCLITKEKNFYKLWLFDKDVSPVYANSRLINSKSTYNGKLRGISYDYYPSNPGFTNRQKINVENILLDNYDYTNYSDDDIELINKKLKDTNLSSKVIWTNFDIPWTEKEAICIAASKLATKIFSDGGEYIPFLDVNDDGKIDTSDAQVFSEKLFKRTSSDPIPLIKAENKFEENFFAEHPYNFVFAKGYFKAKELQEGNGDFKETYINGNIAAQNLKINNDVDFLDLLYPEGTVLMTSSERNPGAANQVLEGTKWKRIDKYFKTLRDWLPGEEGQWIANRDGILTNESIYFRPSKNIYGYKIFIDRKENSIRIRLWLNLKEGTSWGDGGNVGNGAYKTLLGTLNFPNMGFSNANLTNYETGFLDRPSMNSQQQTIFMTQLVGDTGDLFYLDHVTLPATSHPINIGSNEKDAWLFLNLILTPPQKNRYNEDCDKFFWVRQ